MDEVEDTLSTFVASRNSNSSLRPTTTGVIGTSLNHLPLRPGLSVASSLLPPESKEVRPRAPMSRRMGGPYKREPLEEDQGRGGGIDSSAYKNDNIRAYKREETIDVLWANLRHFNERRSRDVNDDDCTYDIQYINIDANEEIKKRDNAYSTSGLASDPPVNQTLFQRRDKYQAGSAFIIPELPCGSLMKINILSTWGDTHYLGLNGIELFDSKGQIVNIKPDQVWASPADINVLKEYQQDPRTVDKLFDGHNHTTDDLHSWLCPFTQGKPHTIYVQLDVPTTISMIRIWNYNKSRIHSTRGARYCEISLDDVAIFKGEIKRARGGYSPLDIGACSECILFTSSKTILELIEKNDPMINQSYDLAMQELEELERIKLTGDSNIKDLVNHLYENDDVDDLSKSCFSLSDMQSFMERGPAKHPMTGKHAHHSEILATPLLASKRDSTQSIPVSNLQSESMSLRPSTASIARNQRAVSGCFIDFVVISSWGDPAAVGLTGIEGVDDALASFKLPIPQVLAGVISLGQVKELKKVKFESLSSPSNLVNGINLTIDSSNMWAANCNQLGGDRVLILRFDLKCKRTLKGLKIWNYNIGQEKSCCGVKHVLIYLDNVLHNKSILRKAPGEAKFEYSQYVPLIRDKSDSKSDYNTRMAALMHQKQILIQEEEGQRRQHSVSASTIPTMSTPDYTFHNLPSRNEENEMLVKSRGFPDDGTKYGGIVSINSQSPSPSYQWTTSVHPTGISVKFVIHSTHGDPHYVGLNGFALYGRYGFPISISLDQVHATPFRDINDLKEIKKRGNDDRRLENLVLQPNDTYDDASMWLAPFTGPSGPPNTIHVLFEEPITISLLKIWNYSKTPSRGVKEFELFLDDVLIFRGSLHPSPSLEMISDRDFGNKSPIFGVPNWGNMERGVDLSQSILFTNDEDIIQAEGHRVPIVEEQIEFIDDGKIVMNAEYHNDITCKPLTATTSRR